jgi:hypothetical protein
MIGFLCTSGKGGGSPSPREKGGNPFASTSGETERRKRWPLCGFIASYARVWRIARYASMSVRKRSLNLPKF